MKKREIVAWLVFSLMAWPWMAKAQVTTGTFVGTVTDPSGARMPGVKVTVTSSATGYRRTTVTAQDGTYVVEELNPGTYQIAASKSGFKRAVLYGIVLSVAQTARIDIRMEVGSTTQRVSVRGRAPTIQTETATIGQVISARQIENLPLNGRNEFLELATLTPGVNTASMGQGLFVTGGSVAANGTSNEASNVTLDGVMNWETGEDRQNFSPDLGIIQEFRISTNTYDAQYGQAGGAQINVITKRGTSQYHGSLYEYFRNSGLDSRPFFQPGKNPKFVRNQFGGTIGGPIPHSKKDFFFFDYAGLRSTEGLTAPVSIPGAALRSGDFQGTGTTIYDPATYNPATGTRQPFPGDVIPANRLSPVTQFFMKTFWPLPTTSGLVNNYVANPTDITNENQWTARYDRNFSEKDTLMFRYTHNKNHFLLPFGNCGCASPFPGLGEDANFNGGNAVLGWNHIFGPTSLNTLKIGFSRFFQDRFNQDTGKNYIQQSGMKGVPRATDGIPGFSIAGWTGINDNYVSPVQQPIDNYLISDIFHKIRGRHLIKFGGGIMYNRDQTNLDLFDRGLLNFGPVYTTPSEFAGGNQFNSLAAFLLGDMTSGFIWFQPTVLDIRSSWDYAFVQDTWNVAKDLTFDLGLRYEVYNAPYDTKNRMVGLDLSTQKFVYAGSSIPTLPGTAPNAEAGSPNGFPRSIMFRTNYGNFLPRIGFAWRMFGNNKTVLRGGYGVFTNWVGFNADANMAIGPPWVPQVGIGCNPDVPCTSLTDPWVNTIIGASTTAGKVALKTNPSPYIEQYSLGVERQISPTMSLDVEYVGNAGRHDYLTYDYNQPFPGPGPLTSRLPYPNFSTLQGYPAWGTNHYDSLQVTLTKSTHGLTIHAFTDYSHAIGNSISGPEVIQGQPIRNYRDWKADTGNTNFDVRNVVSLDWVYDLPVGKGKALAGNISGLENTIIGGWRFSGIARYATGTFSTVGDIVNTSNAGGSRPNMICNPHLKFPTLQEWFNTACFQRAALFTFGNAGVSTVEGPGARTVDLGLYKDFYVRENKRIEFRTQWYNAFNHPVFGSPDIGYGSVGFGRILGAGPGREIEFGLRYAF